MNDKISTILRRLEARIIEAENFDNEMSHYISEMHQELTDRHDTLVSQLNAFMHEAVAKIEKLEHAGVEHTSVEHTCLKKDYFENEKKD